MNMLLLKRFTFVALMTAVFAASCKKDETKTMYANNNIRLTSSQVVTAGTPPPALPPSIGSATLQANYDKTTKLLSYTLNIDTVTGNIVAIHIHGSADSGFLALPAPLGSFPSVSPYAGGVAQVITVPSAIATRRKGTITGSLYADETVIKESDILGGKFYIDIHTNANALYTGFGELRGQIRLF
jgi:hypothetical protein